MSLSKFKEHAKVKSVFESALISTGLAGWDPSELRPVIRWNDKTYLVHVELEEID